MPIIPLFGEGPIKEVHPDIEKFSLIAEQFHNDPTKRDKSVGVYKYDQDNFVSRVRCKNSDCHGGGFDIGRFISRMTHGKQTNLEEPIPCEGYEGPKKLKNRNPRCGYRLEVKAHIDYK